MHTPALNVGTVAAVEMVPQLALDGSEVQVVVIKQRFVVDRRGRVHPASAPAVRHVDELWYPDTPDRSSVKYPSDVSLAKPGTDVVCVGNAIAAGRAPQTAWNVRVRVGPVERRLRVHGPRAWTRRVVGLGLSDAEPAESVAVQWELAFGGRDDSDPKRTVEEPRNPSGRGVARDPATLVDRPGPQVEDPAEPIRTPRDRPAPAGVAAIARHWEPRRACAGTYDDAWIRERMPYPPLDFDPRFFQVAPPPLTTRGHLRGGEPVEVDDMCGQGPLRFTLPRLAYFVGARHEGASDLCEHRAVLDTVLLEPNDCAVELTFRAIVPVPRPARRLRAVQVHDKRVLG